MNEQKKESLDFENTNKERQKELERLKVETKLEKTKVKNFIQNQNNKSDEIMSNINNIFYIENGVTHTYQSVFMPKHISNDQLKNDLDLFLKEFNDKKLYNCFNRHEPKCL